MAYARIFQSGNSQAVRLPKDFRFDAEEVEIFRRGDEVVLRPVRINAAAVFDALTALPDDLLSEERQTPPPQARKDLGWAPAICLIQILLRLRIQISHLTRNTPRKTSFRG
ncbi:antitoxin [Propionivibrio limicola]|uniref:antitoxin n=1 Tax=Propionivibrio limicola TaxID=167645 RepID=UPI001291FBDE|nr:type II toxin-antitoxin system VapB family antitoxin [Propionivibrio limicola]